MTGRASARGASIAPRGRGVAPDQARHQRGRHRATIAGGPDPHGHSVGADRLRAAQLKFIESHDVQVRRPGDRVAVDEHAGGDQDIADDEPLIRTDNQLALRLPVTERAPRYPDGRDVFAIRDIAEMKATLGDLSDLQ